MGRGEIRIDMVVPDGAMSDRKHRRLIVGDGRAGRGASRAKLYFLRLVFDWMAGQLRDGPPPKPEPRRPAKTLSTPAWAAEGAPPAPIPRPLVVADGNGGFREVKGKLLPFYVLRAFDWMAGSLR